MNEGFGECIEMQDDYWEKMELLNVLLECGDVLPLEELDLTWALHRQDGQPAA